MTPRPPDCETLPEVIQRQRLMRHGVDRPEGCDGEPASSEPAGLCRYCPARHVCHQIKGGE